MRVTWTELGKIAGCRGQHIGQAARRNGLKLEADRRVDAEKVLAAIGMQDSWQRYANVNQGASKKQTSTSETEGETPDFYAERALKERALRKLREMEVREREGELMHKDAVEKLLIKLIATAKARLLVLPGRIAQQVAIETETHRCEELLGNGIREALEELSRNPASHFSKSGSSLETTEEMESQRMG